ncbi:Alpha-D-glucose-1-phosphate phosphatase YihX [Mycena sanguinolenta]|uniref:Alpha-D-glucose-1-phosphate phosphatase YihX n=1 Tax=Mycena sanguinolenta TaxID=230812 RepID=A0A8H6ZES9_9AGAR|nr:Alpha-D-glucose-1-phosphate phosphatase YihX [Mycena sanguinolenta]
MSHTETFNTIIFDIGDVLFSWSSHTKTSISSKTLRQILSSPTWFDYERGKLSEVECYAKVGAEFSLPPAEIRQAFIEARESLQSNDDLIDLVRELKEKSNGTLRVFAMSNISLPDYEVLRTKKADWDIFDRIFTSWEAGERKPHLGFYKHVLSETKINPRQAIMVDDKLENILTARSLGLHGIVFPRGGSDKVKRALRNLIGDPVLRGRDYLRRNAQNLQSTTDNGIVLRENFAQLLLLELTDNRDLVDIVEHPRAWNFFHGKGTLTTETFPFDLDTTSLGLTVMKSDKEVANSVMDEMLQYIDSDGIVLVIIHNLMIQDMLSELCIQTYFDHQRPRFDPVVCVNVLTLFYAYNRETELHSTLQWICEVLRNRAYLEGTRYYETAECFLYFLSRLLLSSNDQALHEALGALLKERLQERIGVEGDALQLAMRIVACNSMGVRNTVDLRKLRELQCEDGGFEIGWMYKYGSSNIKIGNRGLTTAFAIKAIEMSATDEHGSPAPSPTSTVVSHSPPASPAESKPHRLSFVRLRQLTRRHTVAQLIADEPQELCRTTPPPTASAPTRRSLDMSFTTPCAHGLRHSVSAPLSETRRPFGPFTKVFLRMYKRKSVRI